MRIVVLDTAASSGGALSILKDFYDYLLKSKDTNEWIFLISDKFIESAQHIEVKVLNCRYKRWLGRLSFDYVWGRIWINRMNPDVVLSLQNTMPIGIRAKKFLYVHQPIPFQSRKRFSFIKKEEFIYAVYQNLIGALIKKSIKRSNGIIVQTEWLKKEISSKWGRGKAVLHCTPNVETIETEAKRFHNNYFIYPADSILYKNHEVIRQACKNLKKKNITDFRVEFTMEGLDEDQIYYIGHISREELFTKYTQGTLIFPSYIESFGYPLEEAKSQGTIILAADCEYAHELLAGYTNAYFFQPFDAEKLAELMEKVIKKKIIIRPYCEKKSKNKNGWERMIHFIKEEG